MKKIPHSWRKLSIKKKLTIPVEYFGINKGDIEKIRKIKDGRKRLIEAARLQYELFKDIHTDLTAWIAGYSSDVAIRFKIGSSKKLREMFIKPKIKDRRISPSWMDIKRNIKLPEEMSTELAEECGIHIGDGNLNIYKVKKGGDSYKYCINSNLLDEEIYHREHIVPLMRELYNFEGYFTRQIDRNALILNIKSKAIVEYKNKILKFPIGNKIDIEIPKQVFNRLEFQKRCIVGILDTDFNFERTGMISGSLTNLRVIKQMCCIFDRLKIKYNCGYRENYGKIRIRKESSIKIIEEWGLHNPKHLSKYFLLKEYNRYFPFTTTTERLAVLGNELDIEELEKIGEKRKIASVKKSASR